MVPFTLPIERQEYLDGKGGSPFAKWFDALDDAAATKVSVSLGRVSNGNFSNVKAVGGGVSEIKIDFGLGYRVYFGRDGDRLIILLGGGTKKRRQNDIAEAQRRWADYKQRK